MTLYLSPELTPAEIRKAAKAGIVGVKSYPRGVTTNSEGGIESYEAYYPVFAAMEAAGLVLNLHGEVPSAPGQHVRAERGARVPPAPARAARRLPAPAHRARARDDARSGRVRQKPRRHRRVHDHRAPPRAHRRRLGGPGVELLQARREVPGRPPGAARRRQGRCVLMLAAGAWPKYMMSCAGHPRFFLGSDSAPHPAHTKATASPTQPCAAGVYTSPILLPLVAHLLDSFGALDKLEGFISTHGRAFYGRPATENDARVLLRRVSDSIVTAEGYGEGENKVVPFWAGKEIGWEIVEPIVEERATAEDDEGW
ncbi:putative dihydroorotase [Grifola frondosa]|uniref:Putative dihydroorotase n=1 Tax=Grifola frondosa TaxID=5627 RepID=A0A1C7MGW4_GRIFR|nr:putative dihydroorotase [Grifola frondosa]